ncbi:MAG: hypothetical protein ABIS18_05525 [Actinomycetota bacterium]
MNATKEILYAAVGVGDLAIASAKKAQSFVDLTKLKTVKLDKVRSQIEKTSADVVVRTANLYGTLVRRGELTVSSIRESAPTKRAVAQTKTARNQTKAAVSSVKKAATKTVEVTKNATTTI